MINQRESTAIADAAKEAKSNLAKFFFENQEKFKALFAIKPPMRLVTELNAKYHSKADMEQLETIIAKIPEHVELFTLPPQKWLDILINGNIYDEDLNKIRQLLSAKGSLSTLINMINQVPDVFERGQLLHYLANSSDADYKEVEHFLKKIHSSEINNNSFKLLYLKCQTLLREPIKNSSTPSVIESILNLTHGDDPETNEIIAARIKAAQNVLRQWVALSHDKVLLQQIETGAKFATSEVAKYVFNPNNREKMAAIFTTMPPEILVAELNDETISQDKLNQLDAISSNKDEYPLLFKLKPKKWLKILTHEKIEAQDLTSLIGADGMGAVSGLLDEINTLPNALTRASAFYFLLHSPYVNEIVEFYQTFTNINQIYILYQILNKIHAFYRTLGLPEENKDSFIGLHHVLYNLPEYIKQGSPMECYLTQRTSVESVLGITPPEPPKSFAQPEEIAAFEQLKKNNKARAHAALKITKACVETLLAQSKLQLTPEQRKQFVDEQDKLKAMQLDRKTDRTQAQPFIQPDMHTHPFIRIATIDPALLQREFKSTIRPSIIMHNNLVNMDPSIFFNEVQHLRLFHEPTENFNFDDRKTLPNETKSESKTTHLHREFKNTPMPSIFMHDNLLDMDTSLFYNEVKRFGFFPEPKVDYNLVEHKTSLSPVEAKPEYKNTDLDEENIQLQKAIMLSLNTSPPERKR